MTQIILQIPEGLKAEVKAEAQRHGVSMAAYVRMILARELRYPRRRRKVDEG